MQTAKTKGHFRWQPWPGCG